MATLTEIKNDRYHYFRDERGLRQGEYKTWHNNGNLNLHAFYLNDNLHGEAKLYFVDGSIRDHQIFVNATNIHAIHAIHPNQLTNKDKFILNLKYGDFPWLP